MFSISTAHHYYGSFHYANLTIGELVVHIRTCKEYGFDYLVSYPFKTKVVINDELPF